MKDEERTRRNLNPHAEARMAMLLWGKEYAARGCGSMDFWEYIDKSRKKFCEDQVKVIREARPMYSNNIIDRKENRIVVINGSEKVCEIWNTKIQESIQDGGRTLKLFVFSQQSETESNEK